jgi:Amt family ammonium transporter
MQRRPSILGVATGAIVGLAAITPASGYVSPLSAMVIGAVASLIAYNMIWLRMKLRIDESLDVFACHGMGSFWGVVAVGLFSSKLINPSGADGWFYGNIHQFWVQLFAACLIALLSFCATYIIAKVIDSLIGLRVKENEELVGLDISQHAESV